VSEVYGFSAKIDTPNGTNSGVVTLERKSEHLPSVSISGQKESLSPQEEAAKQARYEELRAKFREVLDEAVENFGKTGSNMAFFKAINELREAHGLNPLEYDEDLESQAEDNNDAMAARGTVGHFAHGGYEVANGMWGQRASDDDSIADAAADSLYGSTPHRNIILNPTLTRMGAAAGRNYQTARFA
jgi:uncharacterized protein YkwD